MSFRKPGWKYITLFAAVISLSVVAGTTDFEQFFSAESVKKVVDSFGAFGPQIFMAAYILAILFFVSAIVLTVLGGTLFGFVLGSIYVIIAATTAAMIAFALSRKFTSTPLI